jgi:hypothetical protein
VPPRSEALDGLASLEVLLNHFWSLTLVQAEVPGAFGVRLVVDCGVGTVLAKPEAINGVEANLPEDTLQADLALYSLPCFFAPRFLQSLPVQTSTCDS